MSDAGDDGNDDDDDGQMMVWQRVPKEVFVCPGIWPL